MEENAEIAETMSNTAAEFPMIGHVHFLWHPVYILFRHLRLGLAFVLSLQFRKYFIKLGWVRLKGMCAHALESNPAKFDEVFSELQAKYESEAKPKVPEKDIYGMPKKMDMADHWEFRSGIAHCLGYLGVFFHMVMAF